MSFIVHRQTLRDTVLKGPACLTMTPVSPLSYLLTFWYFSLFPPCVSVFFPAEMQHAQEHSLSQPITPCDGSVLLHNEMNLKCLIDFSFTFFSNRGNMDSACSHTGAPGLKESMVSLQIVVINAFELK